MIRKIASCLFIALALSAAGPTGAQNLVMNPSFESVNTGSLLCSWYVAQSEFNAAINNWTMPTGGSTDIFHSSLATSCFCSPFSTHSSSPGTQAPRTGSSMSAMFVYGNGGCSPYREYLQGRLSSALVPGQQYCIEFYVSLADKSTYACNNLGIYFTTAPFYASSMCVYSVTPHANYTGIITDKTNWTLISLTFTPTQAYQYFTLGNFYYDAGTNTTNVGGSVQQTRYFIDDVDIHLCNTNPVVTVNNAAICPGGTATLTASCNIANSSYSWSNGATGATINVSPTTTTTYTVTATTPTGSTASATATVTVNAAPNLSVSANPSQICPGQQASLSATGASTYVWMPGNLTGSPVAVTPSSTTTYTITGTGSNSCTATSTVTVAVNLNPSIITGASPATVCPGQCSVLSATGGSTYVWQPGNLSGASVNVCPSSTTIYTVTGTATNGCTGTATVTVGLASSPTITLSANPASVCPGGCTALAASGAGSYTWMPGNLTGNPVTVCPAAATTYTVTGSSGAGCTGTAAITVAVNSNPQVASSANPQSVCQGQSSSLTATGASSYVWMPGNLSGAAVNVSPAATTTYTVTGTSSNGCTASASVTVTVISNPFITLSASPQSVCPGGCSNVTATGASSYTWMPGSLTGSQNNICPTSSTTYTITGTSGNCSSTANISITVLNNPVITAAASPVLICQGSCSDISASGGISYQWNPGGLNGASANVCPSQTTIYTVTGTDANTCTASATLTVSVEPGPVLNISASPPSLCPGQCSDLTASGASDYQWQPGNLSGTTVNVCPTSTTTYTVTGTSLNGCTGTSTLLLQVTPPVTIQVAAIPAVICSGEFSDLSATGASQYVWQPGNYSGATISVNPSVTTTYTVSGFTNGCSGQNTATVSVYPFPPVSITSNKQNVCVGEILTFSSGTDTSQIDSWLWEFGDGYVAYDAEPEHFYEENGSFDVTLTLTSVYGCTSTLTLSNYIHAWDNPEAAFAFHPDPASILQPEIWFFDQSVGSVNRYWYFGDPNSLSDTSNALNPIHRYPDTGTYVVTLIAISSHGCRDTTLHPVRISPEVVIYIPNAFTPNNDERNNIFLCQGEGIDNQTFTLRIYDRWGKQVFFAADINRGWDGTYLGRGMPEGVYTWYVTFYDIHRIIHKLKGTVTLIR